MEKGCFGKPSRCWIYKSRAEREIWKSEEIKFESCKKQVILNIIMKVMIEKIKL